MKTPVLEYPFNTLQPSRPATLPETPIQVFSCEYCKIFNSTYFEENLRTTASAIPASYC